MDFSFNRILDALFNGYCEIKIFGVVGTERCIESLEVHLEFVLVACVLLQANIIDIVLGSLLGVEGIETVALQLERFNSGGQRGGSSSCEGAVLQAVVHAHLMSYVALETPADLWMIIYYAVVVVAIDGTLFNGIIVDRTCAVP